MRISALLVLFCCMYLYSSAQLEWTKTYNSNNQYGEVQPYDVEAHTSDDIFVVGGFRRSVDFGDGNPISPNPYNGGTNSDGFLMKLDRHGNTKWAKAIADDEKSGDALHISIFGNNLYVVSQDASNLYNYYVRTEMFDTSGALIWSKKIVNNSNCWVKDMYVAPNENVYVLYYRGNNHYVHIYNANGSTLNSFTVTNSSDYEPEDIVVDNSGNVYLIGQTSPASYNRRLLVQKHNATGTLLWSDVYGATNQEAYGFKVFIDDSANLYVAGQFNKSFDLDGIYVSTGTTSSSTVNGFLAKCDNDGNFLWAQVINNTQNIGTSSGTGYQAMDVEVSRDGSEVYLLYGNKFYYYDVNGNPTKPTVTIGGERGFGIGQAPDGSIYTAGDTDYETGYVNKIGCSGSAINLPATIDTLLGSTLTFALTDTSYTVNWYDGNGLLLLGDSLEFEITVQGDTILEVEVFNSAGCPSYRSISITGLCFITETLDSNICYGESYLGYDTSGVYRDTIPTTIGCDTIRILTLTLLDTALVNLTQTICEGDTLEGYFVTGTYTDVYTAANGCDSTRTLQLTVLDSALTTISQTICEGDSYEGYNATGTYTDVYNSYNGCDSTRILNLTVLDTALTVITQTICQGDSYLGYVATGIYTDVYAAFNTCDSTRVLNLTVLDTFYTTITTSICAGQTLDGYSATGVYTDYFTTTNGCDSTRVLNLTVQTSITTTIDTTLCEGGSYNGYAVSGTYTDVYQAQGGCDSTRTLNLTVLDTVMKNISETICQGDSYLGYANTGVYTDIYTGFNGCDSTRVLTLTVTPAATYTINTSICAGDSLYAGGYWQTTAGTYTDTFMAASACDSIVTTNLSVNSLPAAPVVTVQGLNLSVPNVYGSYQWYANGLAINDADTHLFDVTQNGTYYVVVADGSGCAVYSDTISITSVGIDVINREMDINLYPNPSDGWVTVESKYVGRASIIVYNTLGQIVYIGDLSQAGIRINTSEWKNGLYLVRIEADGQVSQHKLIRE